MKSLYSLVLILAFLCEVFSIPYTCMSGKGVRGSFYSNINFLEPASAYLTLNNINSNPGTGKPQPNLTSADGFSVYYSGVIVPSVTGTYKFQLESDDGSRLNFQGSTVLTSFVVQPARNTTSATMSLEAGEYYYFSVDFFENLNSALVKFYWSVNSAAMAIVPNANLLPCFFTPEPITYDCSAAAQGLEGTYYASTDFTSSVLVRTDSFSPFKQDWGTGTPSVVVPVDNFSIRWRGVFTVGATDYYRLASKTNDRVKIYVNDILMLDNPKNDTATLFIKSTSTMYLTAGKYYYITYEFIEDDGTAVMELLLSRLGLSPSGSIQTMPLANIKACFPPAIIATDRVSITGNSFVTILVYLRTQPASDVYVYITPESGATATPCLLIFTPSNWNIQQIVYASSNATPKLIQYNSVSNDTSYTNLNATTSIVGTSPTPTTIVTGPTCTSWGDPHFITFDGKMYDLYTTGDYYLVRSVHSEFVIQTRQLPCFDYSCNYAVAIKYYDSLLIIYLDRNTGTPRVYSNEYVKLLGSGFTFTLTDVTYEITYPNGIYIKARLDYWTEQHIYYMSLYVTVPTYYANSLRGLCGTYDGATANDYHSSSGSTISFSSFITAWTVPSGENLFINQLATIPTITSAQPAPTTFLTCSSPGPSTLTYLNDNTFNINGTATYPSTPNTCSLSTTTVQTHCAGNLLTSALALECASLGVNTTALYLSCVTDILNFCDMEAGNVAGSALVETCRSYSEVSGTPITNNVCNEDCNFHGTCIADNVCSCTGGWTGTYCTENPDSFSCVTSVSPASGVAGDFVTFTGYNFQNSTSIVCRFGSKYSNGTFVSAFQITCEVPAGIQGGVTVQVSQSPGKNCGGIFTYTSGSGSLDPHFFGFHKEKMEVKRDRDASNQVFHLFCSPLVTITCLFHEYQDELLFMTRFWVRLGDLKFTLNLSATPRFVTDHGVPFFKQKEGRHHLEIPGGYMEWDDNVLRVTYRYLKINFSNKIYLTDSPYMNVDIIPDIKEEYPKEDKATGIIGRTLNKSLSPEQFEEYLQFKGSLSDVVDFSCSIPYDLI